MALQFFKKYRRINSSGAFRDLWFLGFAGTRSPCAVNGNEAGHFTLWNRHFYGFPYSGRHDHSIRSFPGPGNDPAGAIPLLKEAAYSLGATRYEVLKNVILPYTKSGLFAGILLSLGRALGETMAVTMVIGNTSLLPTSIFGRAIQWRSVIANEFTETDHTVYLSALIELGLVLFLVTVVINMIGKRIIKRFTNE